MVKITKLLGAALATAGVVIATALAPSAQAATVGTLAAPNCQWGSSYGVVVTKGDVRTYTGDVKVGEIQVCRDSSYNYWGFILFSNAMTASQWGQATLYRYRDGVYDGTVNCDSPNGNDHVGPGQKRCWTPKLSGVSGRYTFDAAGEFNSSSSGPLGDGYTTRTR